MENKKIELKNINEELSPIIYKSLEVFDTIKNTNLKINNTMISLSDKKVLSLFLGIYYTDNSVSQIIKFLRYNYTIEVYTYIKKEEEYNKIYNTCFKDYLDIDKNTKLEELALILFDTTLIKSIHHELGLSLIPIRLLLNEKINEKEKIKTLQI